MTDTHHNEFQFIKRLMLGLLIVNLVGILFFYQISTTLGINCATGSTAPQCQLNAYQSTVTNSTNALLHSWDNPTTTPIVPDTTVGLFGGFFLPLINFLVGVVNVIIHFGLMVAAGILLFANIVIIIVSAMFSLIPAIFSSAVLCVAGSPTCFISTLFTYVYGFSVVILIGYALYLIRNIFMGR